MASVEIMAYHAKTILHACMELIFPKDCSHVINHVSSDMSPFAYFHMHVRNSSSVPFKNNDIDKQKKIKKMAPIETMAYHAWAVQPACMESIFPKDCSHVMNQVSLALSGFAYFTMHVWNSSLDSFKNNNIKKQKEIKKMMQIKI